MTVETYLEWESHQEVRHEYVNGEVLAMAGVTLAHNDIVLNLYAVLRPHLQQKGCRGNVTDAKVQISDDIYRYPDLVTSCDERDIAALTAIRCPNLLVEVLSPSTEARDRGQKFQEYRARSSLQEYVLISSDAVRVEVYR